MRLWKKKSEKQSLWKISTKVTQTREDVLIKTRKNKKPWIYSVLSVLRWFRNYFKTVGWVFLGGLLMVGIFVISATPFFALKPDKIQIVLKPEPVFDSQAIMSILQDFSGKNIFSITTNEVFASLSNNIRHIASVEKTLLIPDGMKITITSFPASYRAFIGEEKFLLTENGQLIPDIPEVEVPALQVYHLVQDPNVGKITPIMDEDMYGIRLILNAWKKNLPDTSISELRFYEQEKELHIVVGKTHTIFSLENGPGQVSLLAGLIAQGKVVLSHLTYGDLRVPNRIYTCATSENACVNNLKNIYGD